MLTTEKIANFIIEYALDHNESLSSKKLAGLTLLFYGVEVLNEPKIADKIKDIVLVDKNAQLISTEVLNAVYHVKALPNNNNHLITKDRVGLFAFKEKQLLTVFMDKYLNYSVAQLYQLFFEKIIITQQEVVTRLSFSVYKEYFDRSYVTADIDISKDNSYFSSIDKLTINELNQFKLFLQKIEHQHPILNLKDMISLLENSTLNLDNSIVKRVMSSVFEILKTYISLAKELNVENIQDINKQIYNYTEELKRCVISKDEFVKQISVIDKYFELKNSNN